MPVEQTLLLRLTLAGADGGRRGRRPTAFYRSRATANISGMGIGLAACRRIVESLGGEITASARTDGRLGAIFSFSLPLAEHDLETIATVSARP